MGSNNSGMGYGGMGKSGGRGISASGTGNTMLQQMMIGNDYSDSGGFSRQMTAIDELANQQLEAIVKQYEDQKI